MTSACLYRLYVYLVKLSSACDAATVGNYMFTKFNACK